MKVLSVRNPWALAIFHGKDIENRDWYTGYRGLVAIHASAKVDPDYVEDMRFIRAQGVEIADEQILRANGHVLGTVEITDCIRQSNSPWFFGPFGFVLKNQRLFETPISAKGKLGFWNWDAPDLRYTGPSCAHCGAIPHGKLPFCGPCYDALDIKLRHALYTTKPTAIDESLAALKQLTLSEKRC